MSKQYLLAIAIGPVQDFIRAGRKTRDLWYGSDLLSRIALETARYLDGRKAELIFPHKETLDRTIPVPNKILALLPEGADAKTWATEAEAVARGVLPGDWDTLKRTRLSSRLTYLDTGLITAQLNNFLEWYVAWHPYDPATYSQSRQRLEYLLAGRKQLRDFAPAPSPEPTRGAVRKSSLDPARDSVLDIRNKKDEEPVRSALHLKTGEEIDGVSLVKRLAQPARFVSLARIAIEPFVERAGEAALQPLVKLAAEIEAAAGKLDIESHAERFETANNNLGHLKDLPYDTQLFWDDGKRDVARLLKEDKSKRFASRQAEIDAYQAKLRCFYDTAHKLRKALDPPFTEFPTYLAVLRADGDRMGKALGDIDTYQEHQEFSKRLTTFAASAREIVANHGGALVFSGGDDVLAFLPLHTALCCADKLRCSFRDTVNADPANPDVTLSVGVAIGYYSEHLDHLIDWAKDAEETAKAAGRNALAVVLYTRSGGAESASRSVRQWNDGGIDLVADRWLTWVKWHRSNTIPDGAAFDLRDLAVRLGSLPRADLTTPRYERKPLPGFDRPLWSLLDVEVERVLRRKRSGHGKDELTDAMIGTILAWLGNNPEGLDKIVNELLIARRLAAVSDIAYGAWKEGQDACTR